MKNQNDGDLRIGFMERQKDMVACACIKWLEAKGFTLCLV